MTDRVAHKSSLALIVALEFLLVGTYMLMGATAASASPGLTVGIAGNQFIDMPADSKRTTAELGLGGVRVFLEWHGEEHVTERDRQRLAHLDQRSLVSVYGFAPDAPLTAPARRAYAAYVAEVAALFHPWAISVWNEPNLSYFWPKNGRQAEDYTRLLARSYDAIKRVDPAVKVLGGETVRSYGVERFIKRMGKAYKAMRRSKTRKLMDGFAHHPYPVKWADSATRGGASGGVPMWLVQGDARRLRAALAWGFRGTKQKRWTPIYWTETGWATGAIKWGGKAASPDEQAERMVEAVELAYCQRRVKGIFFFGLWDDGPGGWLTGVLDNSLNRKPSFGALATAIQNVNTGNVDCSKFPQESL